MLSSGHSDDQGDCGLDSDLPVLVGVAGSPGAARTVELAARLAQRLGVTWHAIFVETPRGAREPSVAERAGEALMLAAELGASVSREPAATVGDGIVAHLESSPAGHLVIGIPRTLWRGQTFGRSTLRTVLLRSPDLVVHLAPGAPTSRARQVPSPSAGSHGTLRDYGVSLALVLVTVGICELLTVITGARPLSLLFIFPVITAAARLGLLPALVATAASVLSFDLFLLEPRLHLEPLAPVNLILWVALIAIAVYTSAITRALRSRIVLSDRSAKESARIVTFAQTLTKVSDWTETAQAVCDEMAAVLNVEAMLFRKQGGELIVAGAQPTAVDLSPLDRGALDYCSSSGTATGAGTGTIASADWRFEPLKTSLGVLGVLAIAGSDGHDPVRAERRVLFATYVSQAALALERLFLEDDRATWSRNRGPQPQRADSGPQGDPAAKGG